MDVNERVMENLKAFGLDTDIKPVTMKHLAKVDEVLASMVQAQTDAIQEIRNNKISINRVAKESGIARQTVKIGGRATAARSFSPALTA